MNTFDENDRVNSLLFTLARNGKFSFYRTNLIFPSLTKPRSIYRLIKLLQKCIFPKNLISFRNGDKLLSRQNLSILIMENCYLNFKYVRDIRRIHVTHLYRSLCRALELDLDINNASVGVYRTEYTSLNFELVT